jgi:hypothetical protein
LPSSEQKLSAPAITPHAIAVYASRPLSPGATQHALHLDALPKFMLH